MTEDAFVKLIINETANSIAIRKKSGELITKYSELFKYLNISKFNQVKISNFKNIIVKIKTGDLSYLFLNPVLDTRIHIDCPTSIYLSQIREDVFNMEDRYAVNKK